MKRLLLLLLLLVISFTQVRASHLEGGEITWECIKSGPTAGMYIFKMKVYRDCNGVTVNAAAQTIQVHNHPSITSIVVDFTGQFDMSPICDPINSGNLQMDCINPQQGSVEAYEFESQPLNMPGVPPVGGWHFTWSSCCRNTAISNIANPSSLGFTLRAIMYSYSIAGVPQNTSPCFDSSPIFYEKPKTIICTGYPFSYSHNASDPELDSIVYSWGDPLDDGVYNPVAPLIIPFLAPYTVNSQIPGNPVLDPNTGEISYHSLTAGNFVTCIKVEAYKCAQLVAEIYREIQVILILCPNMAGGAPNTKPLVNPPFAGGTSFATTVFAGTFVSFNISGNDNDIYANGSPQDLTLEVSGGQFAADYITTTACLNPPCATFNNGMGIVPPFSAPSLVSGVFEWQTTCDHISSNSGCNNTSNLYTFLVKVTDDFCPAPAITIATLSIEVLAAPTSQPPDIRCVSVDASGNVTLNWEHLSTTSSGTIYHIYSSTNQSGPFTLLDTVGYPTQSYFHIGANADVGSVFYYMTSESDCAGTSVPSDTLQSIKLDVIPIASSTIGDLAWNKLHTPLLSTSSLFPYTIYAANGSGGWTNVGSTVNNNFQFPAQTCGTYQELYVTLEDSSGCFSVSSIDGTNLQDTITPNNPVIEVVTVTGGKSEINWTSSSADVDLYAIYILDEFGAWITIDSVFGVANTTYIYNTSNAIDRFETFRIRAIDSCGNASGTSLNHNTIHLTSELDVCDYSIYFNWNDYNNMVGSLSHYKVMISETNSAGIVVNSEERFNIGANNYTLPNIASGSFYLVKVVAYNSDSTIASFSNIVNVNAALFSKPQFNYITTATVNHESKAIELTCHVDNSAVIDYYKIFRSKREDNSFVSIAKIPFNGSSFINYTDVGANASLNYYKYQVYPVDTCGVILSVGSTQSATDTSFAQSVLLETVANNDMTNDITFNDYDGWLGDDVEYNLYRSVNRGEFSVLPLATFTGGIDNYLYFDNVAEFSDGNGRFCYYVEALEGNTNPYGFVERSLSNISCISQVPILIIPNTFTPNDDEHNEIFFPTTSFVSEIGYSFVIYDKWGHEIFQTNDPSKGWDGNYLGNPVQNGNYVYHVQYVNGVGSLTEKTDIVILVR